MLSRINIWLIICIGLLIFISACSPSLEEPNYTIDGDSVYVDDAKVYINLTPHTRHTSGLVYGELISKVYSGNVNIAFGFDQDGPKPRWLQYNNSIGEWANIQADGRVDYEYAGMDRWYYAQNLPINVNQSYKFRFYLDVPFHIKGGKYAMAIWPSSETIQEAINNDHFYILDPWYDYNLDEGLMFYYAFDQGNYFGDNCTDLTGHGYDCVEVGPPPKSTGILNESFNFTAGNGELLNRTADSYSFTEFTVCHWINSTATADEQDIYNRGPFGASTSYCNPTGSIAGCIRTEVRPPATSNEPAFLFRTDSAGPYLLGGVGVNIITGTWQYMCGVYNGTGAQLYVNGTLVNETSATGTFTSNHPFRIGAGLVTGDTHPYNGGIDEFGFWNRSLTANEISGLYNNGNGLAYQPSYTRIINISITPNPSYPNATQLNCSAYVLNINSTSTGFLNVSLNWTNGSTVVEQNSFSNVSNNSLVSDLYSTDFGALETWGCSMYANDYQDSQNFQQNSTNITISLFNITQYYFQYSDINSTAEGGKVKFYLRLNITNVSTSPKNVSLQLNNNQYNPTTVDSGVSGGYYTYNYSLEIAIPDTWGNSTGNTTNWNWIYSINNYLVNYSTNNSNITIFDMGVDNCSSNANQILNFTLKDEGNRTTNGVSGIVLGGAVNIASKENSSVVFNYSTEKHANSLVFCVPSNALNFTEYWLNTIVRYESTSRAIEYYNIINSTLDMNFSQNISLYDLADADNTDFRFSFKGADFLPVENALVYLDRQYVANNTFETVELPVTDSNGETVLHMVRNDVLYNIRVVKNGQVLGNFERIIAFCDDFSIGDCKISLNAFQSGTEVFDYDSEIGITYSNPTYDNSTGMVSFTFLSTDGTTKDITLEVISDSVFGNRTLCENSLTASSGTILCDIGTNLTKSTVGAVVYISGVQKAFTLIKILQDDYGVIGYFVFFVMILGLVMTLSSESKTLTLLGLLIGFVGGAGMGLISSSLIGQGVSLLWMVIVIIAGIWRLNRERPQ